MIEISDTAAHQILQSADDGGMSGMALRLAVKKDDSGSFEYGMGFDDAHDDDIQIESNGIKVVFSPAYLELLRGTRVDYVELEEGQHHFIFLNPNDPNFIPPKPDTAESQH